MTIDQIPIPPRIHKAIAKVCTLEKGARVPTEGFTGRGRDYMWLIELGYIEKIQVEPPRQLPGSIRLANAPARFSNTRYVYTGKKP